MTSLPGLNIRQNNAFILTLKIRLTIMLNNLKKSRSIFAVLVGLALIVAALTADSIGIGAPGFGHSQYLALAAGVGLVACGLFFSSPVGKSKIRNWRSKAASCRPTVWMVLATLIWFALVTGMLEVGIQAYQRFERHQMVRLGLPAVWMSPLSNVFLFILPGLAGLVAARVRRVSNVMKPAIVCLVFVSTFGLLQDWEPRLGGPSRRALSSLLTLSEDRFSS
jgi:hypothetical protein